MKLQSINPATEEAIGEFDVFNKKDVSKAVKTARKALEKWKKLIKEYPEFKCVLKL